MSRKYKFLQPSYFDKFRCSGGDCKLNCCDYNWKITVDKETYDKCKKVKMKPMADQFKKHIKRDRTAKSLLNYSTLEVNKINAFLDYKKIEKDKTENTYIGIFSLSKCPFQTEDKLCAIHRDLGLDYLSNTCKVFPRNCTKLINNYENSLSSGCEEVSRLLFNEKDGIKFELADKDFTMKSNSVLSFKNEKELMIFDSLRSMCIGILQLNKYSIENRMILLTLFMFKVSDIYENNKAEVPAFIEQFANSIEEYEKLFDVSRIRHDIFLNVFVKELSQISNYNGDFHLIKDLQIVVQKLKHCYTKDEKIQLLTLQVKDLEKYEFEEIPFPKRNPLKNHENGDITSAPYKKFKKNTDKLMKDKQYYIENLLVNSFFTNRYPLNGSTIQENCVRFVISYCFYKGLLTGFMGEKEEFDEELLHRICTVWGRRWADQLANLDLLASILKEQNMTSLSSLIVLIKSC